MIFSYSDLGICETVEEYQPLVICVEKQNTMVQLISAIKQSIENSNDLVIVTDAEKKVNLSKEAAIIIDPWSIDCNSKQIKTKLYQLLLDISQEQIDDSFIKLRTDMFRYIEGLSEHVPYNISYNMQLDASSILKCLEVVIEASCEDFMEQIVEYMKLMQSLCKTKVIFFVNLKSYLSTDQLEMLYKEAKYINQQLVLIEHTVSEHIINEKVMIIDQDDCIINI